MSATYDRTSYHAQMIARGDTPRQRVARLGKRGAEKDYADRRKLAASIGSADPLLVAPADPASVNIPCWVSNPIAPIEECYRKMDGDLRRMFAKYGGRPEFAGDDGRAAPFTIDDARALGAFAAESAASARRSPLRPDGLLRVHGYDDTGARSAPQRRRGL